MANVGGPAKANGLVSAVADAIKEMMEDKEADRVRLFIMYILKKDNSLIFTLIRALSTTMTDGQGSKEDDETFLWESSHSCHSFYCRFTRDRGV